MDLKQDEVKRGALEDRIMRSFIFCPPCKYYPCFMLGDNLNQTSQAGPDS